MNRLACPIPTQMRQSRNWLQRLSRIRFPRKSQKTRKTTMSLKKSRRLKSLSLDRYSCHRQESADRQCRRHPAIQHLRRQKFLQEDLRLLRRMFRRGCPHRCRHLRLQEYRRRKNLLQTSMRSQLQEGKAVRG